MNRIILIILIIIISSFKGLSGQNWAPDGATYIYNTSYYLWKGYVEVKKLGTTSIQGESADQLQRSYFSYSSLLDSIFTFTPDTFYTYSDSGVVYILDINNQWDTLYNFNADIGDRWHMAKVFQVNPYHCDSVALTTVNDTGSAIINGIRLRYQILDYYYYTPYNNSYNFNRDTVYERIGNIQLFLFPYANCNQEGGNSRLRCYWDDQFPVYKSNWSKDCYHLMNQNEFQISRLEIFPNPSSSYIQIKNSDERNYSIISTQGILIQEGEVNQWIDISGLTSGLYFLRCSNQLIPFIKE